MPTTKYKKKISFPCFSDQLVAVELRGREYRFRDGHVVDRRCVGDPCEIRQHAVAEMVAYAARMGHPAQGAKVVLAHVPCLQCVKLLMTACVGEIHLLRKASTEEQTAFELLAMRVPTSVI